MRSHGAVFRAADAYAAPHTGVSLRIRGVIGNVQRVVGIDVHRAGTPELLPLGNVFSVGIKYLDAIVAAVGDKNAARRIKRNAVQFAELTGARAFGAPSLDEFSVPREFHDARVGVAAMPIRHIDVAIGRGDDR